MSTNANSEDIPQGFREWYTKEEINALLLHLRIAHEGYPPSEAHYVSISDYLSEFHFGR